MSENLASIVEGNARRLGAKTAPVWEGGSLTWADLDRRVSGFARHLSAQGIGPGDRVAILIPNRWSLVVAFLGVLKVDATAASLSAELKQEQVDELLAALRPGALIGAEI